MLTMANERKKSGDKKGARGRPRVENPKPRGGRNINVWVSQEVGDTLDAFVEQSQPQTFHKAVIEHALREYFARRNFPAESKD